MADQTTWAWAPQGYEAGRNPALALLFYLIGWRIQNPTTGEWKLAVGRGVPIDRINLDSFITAANLCDEPVLRTDGTSEPRYRCDGTFSEGDDPSQVIANFETCMNAKLRDSAGRFSLQVLHNDLATPVLDFTDDDVLGDFSWTAGNDLNDRRNVVRGRHTDPSALYQMADFPQIKLPALDGIDRIESLDLALVQSSGQAQRLAKQRVQRQQYEGEFRASFNARGWAVKDGDIVRLTFSALGFNKKLFRVAEGLIDPTGSVPLVLGEEHSSIYAWDREESPAVQAAVPNTFDPLLLPIIAAIDDAGQTADWPAIVGEGKPDDFADVTGENTSKDTNAVGGKPASDLLKSLDELETVTIPAVNKAVADANIIIEAARREADAAVDAANIKIDQATAALAEDDAAIVRQIETIATDFNDRDVATNVRVDEKVALLADADKALGEKIDRIVVDGSYDDTEVRVEIGRVDTAAIDRDSATGRRIDEVKASFSAGGNLLSNTDFISKDGWTFNSEAGSIGGLNDVTSLQWWPVGMNALVIGQENASTDRAGFWQQTIAGIEPGQIYQFSVYAGSHRCVTTLYLDWLSNSGEFIGTRSIDAAEGNPGNGLLTDYHRMFFNEPAPAGAARARIYLIKQGTRAGGNSYAWFLRPQGAKVGSADAALLPYTPGSGDAVQISSAAKISQAATSAADANRSVADLSRSVTATFEGVERTFGGYNERITALSDAQDSYASRASSLEAQASPSGGNLVPNSSLSTLDGWSLTANPGALSSLVLNGAGSTWMIGGVENNLTLYRGPAGPGLFSEVQSSPFAVRAGSTIQLYAMTACHRCRAWVSVFFFNDNGYIGYAGENSAARINAGGKISMHGTRPASKRSSCPLALFVPRSRSDLTMSKTTAMHGFRGRLSPR
ncbi:phage tail protein [Sphingomonas aerolata]|uniref:phage tail protein n=1 Tax=Sphingomonas aerolata TaxID=185951 RepID=UPI002FE07BF8